MERAVFHKRKKLWWIALAVVGAVALLIGTVWIGRLTTYLYPMPPSDRPPLFEVDYDKLFPDLQRIEDATFGEVWVRRQSMLETNYLDPAAFVWKDGVPQYNKDGVTSMLGIDVSEHQGEIDWQAVKADGVEFTMIRVGYRGYQYGKLNEDAYFAQNMEGALAAGIRVGVYFFSQATTAAEAREEAQYVLHLIEPYEVTLPIAVDWEPITNDEARTDNMEAEEINTVCRAFCDTVRAGGKTPLLYMYKTLAYRRMALGDFQNVSFWIAEPTDTAPTFFYRFGVWQYNTFGTVDGITGAVDMNLAFFYNGKML